jgi:hypothetical protein
MGNVQVRTGLVVRHDLAGDWGVAAKVESRFEVADLRCPA